MKLIISGINGFVGKNIYSYFKTFPRYEFVGIEQPSNFSQNGVKQYAWDELNQIKEGDCVIHLAGLAHDTNNIMNEEDYYKVNTQLTKSIFNFFLSSSIKTFIFFSSVKAVADSSNVPLDESIIPLPTTIYGKSKLMAEEYILNNLPNDSRKIYILRPCMIHGPGNKGNLNLLYKLQQKGAPWPLGAFENKRSFCSIDNISFVLKQLIEKNIDSGIYHVADDDYFSTNELIRLMANSSNMKVRIWCIPIPIIKTIAKLGDFLNLPINSSRLAKLTESFIVSNIKIKQALSISHMPFSAHEGIKKTFESF